MASIHTIQADLDKIRPILKEILEKLNNQSSTKDIVEAAAAKIISEMKNCNKEILNTLDSKPEDEEKAIVTTNDDEKRYDRLYLYSFPNHSVGNEELGTGKNPNSMTWPPGFKS